MNDFQDADAVRRYLCGRALDPHLAADLYEAHRRQIFAEQLALLARLRAPVDGHLLRVREDVHLLGDALGWGPERTEQALALVLGEGAST